MAIRGDVSFCQMCGEIFADLRAKRDHKMCQEQTEINNKGHSGEPTVQNSPASYSESGLFCSDCGLECNSTTALSEHQRGHQQRNTVLKRQRNGAKQQKSSNDCLCPTCGKMVSFRLFSRHVKEDHPETAVKMISTSDFSCDICKMTLSTKGHLLGHIQRFHEGTPVFNCPECSKVFQSNDRLSIHLDQHVRDAHAALECVVCEKHFDTQCQLVRHVASHRREGSIACRKCPQVEFVNLKGLMAHQRRHSTGKVAKEKVEKSHPQDTKTNLSAIPMKEYRCHVCGMTFFTEIALQNHGVRVHGIDEFGNSTHKCPLCATSFTNRNEVLDHVGVAHLPKTTASLPPSAVKVFKCRGCSRVFASSGEVFTHYQAFHTQSSLNMPEYLQ